MMVHFNHKHIANSREAILATACSNLARDLREIDPADYYLFFRYGELPDIYDRVNAMLDRHFANGTFSFACTGDANINWDEIPAAAIDLEFFSKGIFVYFRLFVTDDQPRVEIHHIVFQESAGNPSENTSSLEQTLKAALLASATPSGINE